MKLNDILTEGQVNELGTTPMGIGSRLLKGTMAKLGSSKAAADLDVGKRANILEKTFSAWARRSGIRLDGASPSDIDDFLSTNGLPPINHGGVSYYDLTDSETTKLLWTKVAQASFRAGGSNKGLGGRFNVPVGSGAPSIPSTPSAPSAPTTSTPSSLSASEIVNATRYMTKNQIKALMSNIRAELLSRG